MVRTIDVVLLNSILRAPLLILRIRHFTVAFDRSDCCVQALGSIQEYILHFLGNLREKMTTPLVVINIARDRLARLFSIQPQQFIFSVIRRKLACLWI